MRLGQCWYQIGNKTCYKLKVSRFYPKNDIYANRFEDVFFGMKMCVLWARMKCIRGNPIKLNLEGFEMQK